jgi:hypothetical protein
MHTDFTGAKLLVALVLVILIVFAGSVPTAQRAILDTWYGRLMAAVAVLFVSRQAGWWLGIMAAIAVLVLMPQSMREGFMNPKGSFNLDQPMAGEGFRGGGGGEGGGRGGVLETGNQQMNMNFKDYKKERFRGCALETGNAQMNSNFEDYADEDDECLSSIEEPFSLRASGLNGPSVHEGFWGGSDKKQKVPKERRKQWFIEEVMDEQPEMIETDTVETQAAQ